MTIAIPTGASADIGSHIRRMPVLALALGATDARIVNYDRVTRCA